MRVEAGGLTSQVAQGAQCELEGGSMGSLQGSEGSGVVSGSVKGMGKCRGASVGCTAKPQGTSLWKKGARPRQ